MINPKIIRRRKMRRLPRVVVAMLAVLTVASISLAAGNQTNHVSGVIMGSPSASSSAACSSNPADYDSKGPSGNCSCETFAGNVNGKLVGSATSSKNITCDDGDREAAANSTNVCTPFFLPTLVTD